MEGTNRRGGQIGDRGHPGKKNAARQGQGENKKGGLNREKGHGSRFQVTEREKKRGGNQKGLR